MNNNTDNMSDWPVISSYTREQAIADGVLHDVTETAREAGWRIPVAVTDSVYVDCIEWTAEDTKQHRVPQDVSGRLWDVVWMAFVAARMHIRRCERNPETDPTTCVMELRRVPREGRGQRPRVVYLKLVVGPGDDAEPVATIMQRDED